MGARRMERDNQREQLVNSFIIKIFRARAQKQSKGMALIKVKKFINIQGKKWNASLDQLFESTWEKQIPASILAEFAREEKLIKQQQQVEKETKAMLTPKKVRPNNALLQVEIKEQPSEYNQVSKIKPNQVRFGKNSDKSRLGEPEPDDIDDPKWDKPLLETLVKEENRNKICAECEEPFIRLKSSDPRSLCKKCALKLENSFNDSHPNFSYASEEEMALASEIRRKERNRILNIKPL